METKIKLVALDLDDSLLNQQSAISKRAEEAIRLAVSQGIIVIIATGRMFKSAQLYAAQLDLGIPIITYNGGLIKSCISGEIIYHQPILRQLAHKAANLCREQGIYIQSYIDDNLYVAEIDASAEYYSKLAGVEVVPVGDKLYTLPGQPTKMLAMASAAEIQRLRQRFSELFAAELCTCISRPTFLEITHPAVNKGNALAMMAARLGISRENVMAVGDSGNDLAMLQYAGVGVAMGNAPQYIKDIADIVICTNWEDGAAKAIEKLVINQR